MFDSMKKLAQNDQQVSELAEKVSLVLDFIPEIARIHMTYYKELVAQGFTAEQALYLVAKHGVNCGAAPQTGGNP